MTMTDIVLAISTWCQLNTVGGLDGSYAVNVAFKIKCQKQVMECLVAKKDVYLGTNLAECLVK